MYPCRATRFDEIAERVLLPACFAIGVVERTNTMRTITNALMCLVTKMSWLAVSVVNYWGLGEWFGDVTASDVGLGNGRYVRREGHPGGEASSATPVDTAA